jgi:hypothetical protein
MMGEAAQTHTPLPLLSLMHDRMVSVLATNRGTLD